MSYWAHLGGFVCGLFPSFFFLPNLKDKRCVPTDTDFPLWWSRMRSQLHNHNMDVVVNESKDGCLRQLCLKLSVNSVVA